MFAVDTSWKSLEDFGQKHSILWYGDTTYSRMYCVFSDFKSYIEFMKEDDVQPKTSEFGEGISTIR